MAADDLDLPPVLPRSPAAPDLTVDDNGVTFLVVCAGGPIAWTLRRLWIELAAGRLVSVIATPQAAAWFDAQGVGARIQDMTGWPVRSELPTPPEPTFQPPGSSVLVSPCTLNTLTKWADGHSDNLAVSLLCEAVGRGVPTRAEVSVSGPYASHPATGRALDRLGELGVELSRAHRTMEPAHLPPLAPDIAHVLDGGTGPEPGPSVG